MIMITGFFLIMIIIPTSLKQTKIDINSMIINTTSLKQASSTDCPQLSS